MLCKAGIPITQCARSACELTGNAAVTRLLEKGTDSAGAGSAISHGFSKKLGQDFLNAWQVGEETASLDEVTRRLADNAAENAERMFTEFAQWLPRLFYFLVLIFMAAMILKGFRMIFSGYGDVQ